MEQEVNGLQQQQQQQQQMQVQRHGSNENAAQQTTLVAAHLQDLSMDDSCNKQRHPSPQISGQNQQLQQQQSSRNRKSSVIHGRKAANYLRVFDDKDSDVSIPDQSLRKYSGGGLGSKSNSNSNETEIAHGPKSFMKVSVDQRPVLKNTKSTDLTDLHELEDVDATEGVALEPKTSASAIYLTDEDRHILSSYKDISIIDEKDKTSVNLFGPDVVVPPIHIGAARNHKDEEYPRKLTNTALEQQRHDEPLRIENKIPSFNSKTIPDESAIADDDDDDDVEEHGDFPLAVELKPFTNKVGGHTAIFKFSERAVCKALVNTENNWYETIEKEHQELLQFMPRYIGVLNVRQHFHTKEDFLEEIVNNTTKFKANNNTNTSNDNSHISSNDLRNERTLNDQSRSSCNRLASPTFLSRMEDIKEGISTLPEVVLDDNKHIIPNSLYQQYSSSRSTSNSPSSAPIDSFLSSRSFDGGEVFKGNSNQGSGSTSVNTKLQELVVKEAFMRRKPSGVCYSPRSSRTRTGSSSSLKECKHSRSSSSSSNKKSRGLGNEQYLRRNSMKRAAVSTNNVLDVNPSNLEDDDIMFKLDDDVHESDVKSPEQQQGAFNHESVSVEETSHTIVSKFILLEDLTRKLKCPSVLDLKMGTRQYGVDAKRSKQLSQREKCKKTTSRKLGVRLCGLKIWDKKHNYYITRDKYYGRKVRVGWQFSRVLARFLYDGESKRSIVKQIPILIQQLDTLYSEIAKLKSYRLYGSSLLLFYDGDNPQNKRSRVKVNIIDFARCVTDRDIEKSLDRFKIAPHFPNREDQGFLRGIKSLKFYLVHIWNFLTNDAAMVQHGEQLTQFLEDNIDKFNSNWDWLDEYDKEDDAEACNAESPLRVKWRKYELIFDIEPRYADDEVSD
ncbi:inositol polyphosphate kinase KCS1 [Kluyveromyces lactis]|uniref:Kinase n=1 Tax=Kluyveromyces lactis (strain ATCC 8585 / CBS 2359 / DSM 70799 / NBRC 1267 / NRRL Y-1140 / WM37) TaxID=284590 RepID=Q6CW49_KLULA|nr:uncharacterized protein KLLA0_B06952g [Kluyveromyces lactis]CAH02233.1 KLLA0B06952p [Kluyveromyces lactis]|eukprot:XP_451840.1 uncharacterized protein KLLA0_B06952g [Kluyveromyces lactis]